MLLLPVSRSSLQGHETLFSFDILRSLGKGSYQLVTSTIHERTWDIFRYNLKISRESNQHCAMSKETDTLNSIEFRVGDPIKTANSSVSPSGTVSCQHRQQEPCPAMHPAASQLEQ